MKIKNTHVNEINKKERIRNESRIKNYQLSDLEETSKKVTGLES